MTKSASTTCSARLSSGHYVSIALTAGPAALVPFLLIPAILWADWRFSEIRPDYVAEHPATISRAISIDPIGGIFSAIVLLIAVLVSATVWHVVRAYLATANALVADPRLRRRLITWIHLALILQLVGTSGIVLATQFTFANDHDMHMFGSYLLFIGQPSSIGMTGLIGYHLWRLGAHNDGGRRPAQTLLPAMQIFRARFAAAVVTMTVCYVALFIAKDLSLPVSRYAILLVFSTLEQVVLASFVLYLASFVPDLVVIGIERCLANRA